MKKLILMFGFVIAGLALLQAQANGKNKPVMVITTFDSKGISADDIEFVMTSFTTAFTNLGVARIVDRMSFDKIRGELSFQASDWSDSKKVAELGRALNATQVVVGQLMKRGANFFLTARILDVNTTTIISSHLDKVGNIDDFFEKMPDFCNQLISKTSDKNLFIGASSIEKPSSVALGNYKIGDEGPGGGIIFYVDKQGFTVYDGKGGEEICHYLEMSRYTLGESRWYPEIVSITTQTGLGYGKSNTYRILNHSTSERLTLENCAAYRALKYYTSSTKAGEWFLPSKDELNLMWKSQKERVLATCTDDFHLSSSSYSTSNAWEQDFYFGYQNNFGKNYTNSVRVVRAF